MINNLVDIAEDEILSQNKKIVEIETESGKRILVYDKGGRIIKSLDNEQSSRTYELRPFSTRDYLI